MLACQLISKCQGLFEVPAILLPHRLYPKYGTTEIYQLLKENPKFTGRQEKETHFLVNVKSLRMSTSICMGIFVQQQWKFLWTKIKSREISLLYLPMCVILPAYMWQTCQAMPPHAFLFKTLFPHSMACKYIVTVRDPIDQVQSHFYYQLGGETSKDKPCSTLWGTAYT